ncbi:hypothetical protein FEM48_Zijuj07G0081300 [Ziziphus jujuba var. spinosa]|uniref:Beta-amyrin synthase-like n=1 Tax=Ziziphus jujuba var. spinosa TaxID=714518 RepID=A0A978V3H0_ZIZJJ|nr:hypothetical protein FEM48_Zijuj07G0081300 [Ziziphus jujuba var. spinosa]
MWKIKFGGGEEDSYLFSTNNFLGRQIWEYDADAGSPEERDEVEKARQHFYQNRFNLKACNDLLWRLQLLRKKKFKQSIPQEKKKVEDGDKKISYKTADATMRRAINFTRPLACSECWCYVLRPSLCQYPFDSISLPLPLSLSTKFSVFF